MPMEDDVGDFIREGDEPPLGEILARSHLGDKSPSHPGEKSRLQPRCGRNL